MKKWRSVSKRRALQLLILCLFMPVIFGIGETTAAAAAPTENGFSNAGFEMVFGGQPAGWTHSAGQLGTDFGVSDQEKHSGTYSAFIDHSTGEGWPNWEYTQGESVSDAEEYEFSVWLKVADLEMTGRPVLALDCYDSNNAWINGPSIKMEKEEFTGDWQRFVYRFQPAQGVVHVKPYLMVAYGTGKVYFDDASFVQLNADPEPTEGTYRIWTAPSTMNIMRDAVPLSSNTVNLEMAKREYQSGQVLLTANGGFVDITEAVISDLTSGSATIPASQVEVLVQHYIKTTTKSNNAHEPGWYPDALIPIGPYMNVHGSIQVQSGNNQAIWFTVKTEENTPAGLYSGTISITANGNTDQVPINVKVRDFALPEQNHAQTAFAIWGGMLSYGYPGLAEGSSAYWDVMKNYYEFLLNYHVTPTSLPIPADDYDQYITDAEPYINDPRVSAYNLPYTIGDFESGRAKQLVDGLKAKGLLDKAYYYLGAEIDEPSAAMFPKVKLRSQQIKAIDPALRHLVTTGLTPELMDDVNTFTPLFRDFESQDYLQQVQQFKANGGNIWWYGCVLPANPYPTYHIDDDLISARLVPWMQHSYNIEGNLYWSVNIYGKWTGSWPYKSRDVWNDPLAFPGANGDGFLLYPGFKYGMDSPIATLRLQTIRDGNQDYEYLWLLEERINEAAQQLGVTVSAKELIQPYYDRLFTNVKSFTKSAQDLQQVRSEIADFIEELAKDPQALVVIKDQPNELSKKEVVVYAAKGTEVSINQEVITGMEISGNQVSDRYSYTMDFGLGTNEVQIQLKQGTHELAITKRVFVKSRVLQPIMRKQVIHDFPDQQSISGITTVYGASILGITEDHATGDGNALKVKIPANIPDSYPGIRIPVREDLKDFKWAETIELDVYNAANEPKDMFIKFYDQNGAASDHRIRTIAPGENHLSFNLSEVKNDIHHIASIVVYTLPGSQEAELYISDLHLLGVDTEAMKQYDLPFTQVIPYVDGNLNEQIWKARSPLTYKTGVTDNEAAISYHYNDEYLFVAASVKDNHVVNSGAANPWDDDSLEIYVDGTGKQGTYDDHTVRYVFRVNDPQVHIYRVTPRANEKIKYSYAATADGYNMEIAIPWRSLDIDPVLDNIIGLTAHVNDKDVNDASLPAAGKLALTEDSSQDAVSSSSWLPKKFVKQKTVYQIDAVESNAMNIDGKADETAWHTNWNIGYKAFGNLLDENSGGRLGLLWSPEYLYAAFDVKDGNIHVPKTRPVWEETSVELFVDSEFVQGVRDSRTHQYTIRVDDPEIYYNGLPDADLTQGIIQKSTRTADGYQVEMAIPWTTIGITAEAGKKIGITVHLNLVERTSGAALSLTDNGIMDGASTANYVAFEMKGLPVVNSYTVSFNSDGGTAVPDQIVSHGSKATKPADPTKAGYTFQGWFTDGTYAAAFDFDAAITGNATAHAKWEGNSPASYKVSFVTYGGTAVPDQTVSHGSKATKPADPTKAGYTFQGWYTDGTYATAFDFEAAIMGNATAHAKWEANSPASYKVSFVTHGGTAVPDQIVIHGSKVKKPADPTKAGYTFQGWFTDGTYATAFDFEAAIMGNMTAHAKWAVTVDPVDVPPTSTNGGIAGNSQGTGSTASEYVVKAQDIASKQPKITFAEGQEKAIIALELLQQLRQQNTPLTIEQGDAQLTLSQKWIDELLKSGEAADSDNLTVELRAAAKEEGQSLVSLAANKQNADISLPEQVWEVLVKWTNGDKEQAAATPFKAPLVLSLPVAQEKLANYHIYRFGPDGELVYLNEEVSDERLSVQLFEGGQIAGLIFVKKFDDLSKVQWAVEAIRELAARQIIKGTSATAFAPAREITRAEFAAMLARVLGLEEKGSSRFTDVSSDAWFAGAVNAVAQAGLVKGQGNDHFAPHAAITREEMAVMLRRALEWQRKQPLQSALSYSYADDAQISSWAKEATQVLTEMGIMAGRGNNNFVPKVSVNRAEAAQAIYNYLNKQ
ncbi:glycoside hydrolase domain-containing protein [Paenibacillus sp. GCM10027626]|uniref:glycoside hydrolase domain-containing protein n=1 Tax=Paenibacillus sp. GCM10027626 TaxID=3273411 RepID=UPI003627257D